MFRLNRDPVRLVVLNACATGTTAQAIRPNVGVVVGTTKAVDDPTAVLFSESFYRDLAQGKNVQWAYERACNLCALAGRLNVTMLLAADGVDPSTVTIPRNAERVPAGTRS